MQSYIYNLICTGLICATLKLLLPDGPCKTIMKLLCGLFLTISLLQPLMDLDLALLLSQWTKAQTQEQESVTALGEEYTRSHLAQVIKQETQAYILDKAAALDLSVTAEVFLSDSDIPVPVSAAIAGDFHGDARAQLEQILEKELNIPKENQLWTETNSAKKE